MKARDREYLANSTITSYNTLRGRNGSQPQATVYRYRDGRGLTLSDCVPGAAMFDIAKDQLSGQDVFEVDSFQGR